METIIGFAAGYLVGAKEGSAGLDRFCTSLKAIVNSREARRLTSEAMTAAGTLVRQASARGAGATASSIAELVLRRVTESGATRAA
jgi:hypothetical protein